ncbi:MAG: hypothetical protein GY801_47465 [bacterium]|nr:hypothetical protein [bacterium]
MLKDTLIWELFLIEFAIDLKYLSQYWNILDRIMDARSLEDVSQRIVHNKRLALRPRRTRCEIRGMNNQA